MPVLIRQLRTAGCQLVVYLGDFLLGGGQRRRGAGELRAQPVRVLGLRGEMVAVGKFLGASRGCPIDSALLPLALHSRAMERGLFLVKVTSAIRQQLARMVNGLTRTPFQVCRVGTEFLSTLEQPLFALVSLSLPVVGFAFPLVGPTIAFVGEALPLVGFALPFVGFALPLVGFALPLVGPTIAFVG